MSTVTAEAPAPQAPSGAHVVAPRRSWRQPVVLWVLGLVSLVAFGVGSPGGTRSTFGLSTASQVIQLPPLPLPTRPTAIVLALVGLAIAAVVTLAAVALVRPELLVLAAPFGLLCSL